MLLKKNMKTVLLILVSFIICGQLHAKCLSQLLEVYPQSGVIREDSWIILEGYGGSQEVINKLNKVYPVRLLSEKDTISLELKYLNKGLLGVTQAVFLPERKPIIGESYRLKIDSLDIGAPFLQKEIVWTVEAGTTEILPSFIENPKLLGQNVTYFACGPEVYSTFKIETKNRIDQWVKTELVDLEEKTSTTYLLKMEVPNTLNVGHGMCYGPFDYKEGRRYKIRFSLVDSYGKEVDKWSPWIEFKSPFDTLFSSWDITIISLSVFAALLVLIFLGIRGRKKA
jgi:hypothetical protein